MLRVTLLMSLMISMMLCLGACGPSSSDSPPAPLELAVEGSLRAGASTGVKGESIQVTFVEVTEDSRCPKDTTCAWAGEVKTTLAARIGSEPVVQREVLEGRSMIVEPYRITVTRVLPDPLSTQKTAPGDYRISLIVVKI
jgi:hypothetical protein